MNEAFMYIDSLKYDKGRCIQCFTQQEGRKSRVILLFIAEIFESWNYFTCSWKYKGLFLFLCPRAISCWSAVMVTEVRYNPVMEWAALASNPLGRGWIVAEVGNLQFHDQSCGLVFELLYLGAQVLEIWCCKVGDKSLSGTFSALWLLYFEM